MPKENSFREANTQRSRAHPSNETESQNYRPSKKVGYKVIHSTNDVKRCKQRVEPTIHLESRVERKKFEQPKALEAGNFVNQEYIKKEEKQPYFFHRKGVAQSREKYQSGNAVKQSFSIQASRRTRKSYRNESCQSLSRYSTQKSVLPSYQQEGIKDIMEYQHAGKYREIPVTEKCTKSTIESRLKTFSQMHEFDFRKRPHFLR